MAIDIARDEVMDREKISPFAELSAHWTSRDDKRKAIAQVWDQPEQEVVSSLFDTLDIPDETDHKIHQLAHSLASSLRKKKVSKDRESMIQNLLQEYSLSSREGVALMCLAEACCVSRMTIPATY
ncbi:hypothetical protein AU509_12760 [Lonsdalea britannica]|nr:hypothetical protein AU509_12760 [Lonsdalea britannica]